MKYNLFKEQEPVLLRKCYCVHPDTKNMQELVSTLIFTDGQLVDSIDYDPIKVEEFIYGENYIPNINLEKRSDHFYQNASYLVWLLLKKDYQLTSRGMKVTNTILESQVYLKDPCNKEASQNVKNIFDQLYSKGFISPKKNSNKRVHSSFKTKKKSYKKS